MPGGTNLPNCDLARTLAEPLQAANQRFAQYAMGGDHEG